MPMHDRMLLLSAAVFVVECCSASVNARMLLGFDVVLQCSYQACWMA